VEGPQGFEGETVEKICSILNSKFCCSFQPPIDITFKFRQPILVRGYAWRTGNDHPLRDPRTFSLLVRAVNIHTGEALKDDLDEVHHFTMPEHDDTRFKMHRFALNEPVWTDRVVFRVKEVYDSDIF